MGRTHRHDPPDRPARAMRAWPFTVGASALAIAAGVLVAGLPANGDSFVLGPAPDAPLVTEASESATTALAVPRAAASVLVAVEPPAAGDAGTVDAIAVATTTTFDDAPTPAERGDIALLVANGARTAGLAGTTAATLTDLGYTDIHVGNALVASDVTVIYFAPGFEDEAVVLAADLGKPDMHRSALPDGPLLSDDSYAGEQLALVLGRDALP